MPSPSASPTAGSAPSLPEAFARAYYVHIDAIERYGSAASRPIVIDADALLHTLVQYGEERLLQRAGVVLQWFRAAALAFRVAFFDVKRAALRGWRDRFLGLLQVRRDRRCRPWLTAPFPQTSGYAVDVVPTNLLALRDYFQLQQVCVL